MSELTIDTSTVRNIRWHLMSTVCAVAMLTSINVCDANAAEDGTDRPTVWIDIGGQMEKISGQGDAFSPAFLAANSASPVLQPITPVQAQRPPPFDFALEGKITIQPADADWVFIAGIRYGRSSNYKHVEHQTSRVYQPYNFSGVKGLLTTVEKFADTQVHRRQSNTIVDFSAGKDIGLGLFGKDGTSVINAGIRFAQFTSRESLDIQARPDLRIKYFRTGEVKQPLKYYNNYHASGSASRSFRGVGPTVSWNGSAPIAGTQSGGQIALEWGANAAVLFGRQKARVRHEEDEHYHDWACNRIMPCSSYAPVYHRSGGHDTDRTVTVPNVGGFAAASFRVENFKVSAGYRADFFFGALDGGIDARKSETLGFYGPFATISVGLGG